MRHSVAVKLQRRFDVFWKGAPGETGPHEYFCHSPAFPRRARSGVYCDLFMCWAI